MIHADQERVTMASLSTSGALCRRRPERRGLVDPDVSRPGMDHGDALLNDPIDVTGREHRAGPLAANAVAQGEVGCLAGGAQQQGNRVKKSVTRR
jgi:hypothetical protein